MMIIIDAHEDLAYAALTFQRDYTQSAAIIRQSEQGTFIPSVNGHTMLGWQEYQRGNIAIIFATLFITPERYKEGEWDVLCYRTFDQARTLYWQEMDYYRKLSEEHPDKFRLVLTRQNLQSVLKCWENEQDKADSPIFRPTGLVILMESAEGIRHPRELEEYREAGVRIVGPVWAGGRFCGGSMEGERFTKEGYELLEVMATLGLALDVSHMNEISTLQALDTYEGVILASHSNARALTKYEGGEYHITDRKGERHLSDLAIRRLVERDGVIGVLPYNRFLRPGWSEQDGRHLVTLKELAAHIDHICQIAGDARHVGIGTDFDGGFGYPAIPQELETIADLQKLADILTEKGYQSDDIAAILGRNWQHILEKILPE